MTSNTAKRTLNAIVDPTAASSRSATERCCASTVEAIVPQSLYILGHQVAVASTGHPCKRKNLMKDMPLISAALWQITLTV